METTRDQPRLNQLLEEETGDRDREPTSTTAMNNNDVVVIEDGILDDDDDDDDDDDKSKSNDGGRRSRSRLRSRRSFVSYTDNDQVFDKKRKILTGPDALMCHQCQRNDKGRVIWCMNCMRKRYCVRCFTRWYSVLRSPHAIDR